MSNFMPIVSTELVCDLINARNHEDSINSKED